MWLAQQTEDILCISPSNLSAATTLVALSCTTGLILLAGMLNFSSVVSVREAFESHYTKTFRSYQSASFPQECLCGNTVFMHLLLNRPWDWMRTMTFWNSYSFRENVICLDSFHQSTETLIFYHWQGLVSLIMLKTRSVRAFAVI